MPYQIINAGAYMSGQVRAGIITQEDADLRSLEIELLEEPQGIPS